MLEMPMLEQSQGPRCQVGGVLDPDKYPSPVCHGRPSGYFAGSQPMTMKLKLNRGSLLELAAEAQAGGMTIAEFVANALRVYVHLLREQRRGKSLYYGVCQNDWQKLVLP